jgi:hypothetical protein
MEQEEEAAAAATSRKGRKSFTTATEREKEKERERDRERERERARQRETERERYRYNKRPKQPPNQTIQQQPMSPTCSRCDPTDFSQIGSRHERTEAIQWRRGACSMARASKGEAVLLLLFGGETMAASALSALLCFVCLLLLLPVSHSFSPLFSGHERSGDGKLPGIQSIAAAAAISTQFSHGQKGKTISIKLCIITTPTSQPAAAAVWWHR